MNECGGRVGVFTLLTMLSSICFYYVELNDYIYVIILFSGY